MALRESWKSYSKQFPWWHTRKIDFRPFSLFRHHEKREAAALQNSIRCRRMMNSWNFSPLKYARLGWSVAKSFIFRPGEKKSDHHVMALNGRKRMTCHRKWISIYHPRRKRKMSAGGWKNFFCRNFKLDDKIHKKGELLVTATAYFLW